MKILKLRQWGLRNIRHLFRVLPKEGSYIELPIKYQYGVHVWKGIVKHHEDKTHYMIESKTSVLCAIKP